MHGVPLINHPCTLCCRPTSMWCSRCQSAWYCSAEHIYNVSLLFVVNEFIIIFIFVFQDWPRHRAECIPAMSPTSCYNVNMIATPPPAEPQLVNVSAILFSPEEGELTEIILTTSNLVTRVQRDRELLLLAVDRLQRFLKECAPFRSWIRISTTKCGISS